MVRDPSAEAGRAATASRPQGSGWGGARLAVATVGGSSLGGAHVLSSREFFPYGEPSAGGAVQASARSDGKRRDAESGC